MNAGLRSTILAILLVVVAAPVPARAADDRAVGDRGNPVYPEEGQAWIFFDGGEASADLLDRARQAARSRGYSLLEFELSNLNNLDLLRSIKRARGIRWDDSAELYVGERHVLGTIGIRRFLEGWEAGTESIVLPAPAPEAGKEATAGPSKQTATEGKKDEPVAPPEAVKQTAPPGPEGRVMVQGATGEGHPGILKRYRFSIIALVAAAVFFLLALWRRDQPRS